MCLALGIDVPDRARCAGHDAPLDYLDHVFFEQPGDAVVWASRGGGKTFYGAVATLLDLLFKPGIEVRLLGGSFEQSDRMYGYLRRMLEQPGLRRMVRGRMKRRGVELVNGSRVELLAQAETSVRGHRVQKLRCDEVDLFDPDVWDAAQFVTRAARCGQRDVRGSIECFSTLHNPYGLMHELVGRANDGSGAFRLFRWSALDVMQRCDLPCACAECPLDYACRGAARRGRGFVAVADVLDQLARSSRVNFDSEMLCRRPRRRDLVYPMFDPSRHVRSIGVDTPAAWIGGMDFGLRSPMVMLWAQCLGTSRYNWRVRVVDEYVAENRTVEQNLLAIGRRTWPCPGWVGVDPAGGARNDQTGLSTIDLVGEAGYRVRTSRTRLTAGVELVRRYLQPADGGEPRLLIDPRCERLIRSLAGYHYDGGSRPGARPAKDGHDHAADALRYMLVNLHQLNTKVKHGVW